MRYTYFIALDEDPQRLSLLDNAAWKAAVVRFNENFTQAEKEAGTLLRPRIASASGGDPSVVLLNQNYSYCKLKLI